MVRIFLDESGDLGFSSGSSRFFILTIILTTNHRKIEKVIKKAHKSLRKKYKKVGELHSYNSDPPTRKRVLKGLAEINECKILCIILNKEKVYTDLQKQKQHLYNYAANILLDRLHNKKVINDGDKYELFIDRRETNKFLNNNFINYLTSNLSNKGNGSFDIKIKSSETEKCLQAVDFVSWSIFRKHERKDDEYYKVIKNNIIEENFLFK